MIRANWNMLTAKKFEKLCNIIEKSYRTSGQSWGMGISLDERGHRELYQRWQIRPGPMFQN